jgi:hypothetical protein
VTTWTAAAVLAVSAPAHASAFARPAAIGAPRIGRAVAVTATAGAWAPNSPAQPSHAGCVADAHGALSMPHLPARLVKDINTLPEHHAVSSNPGGFVAVDGTTFFGVSFAQRTEL